MMSSRRKNKPEEAENLERWLISYSDFMTLLVAFFVVMYAISSVNEGKYRVLSATLMSVFTHAPTSTMPIRLASHVSMTPSVKPVRIAPNIPRVVPTPMNFQPESNLAPILTSVKRALAPLIKKGEVSIGHSKIGIVIHINADLLFPSGSALMNVTAIPILSRLGMILQTVPNPIQIQGYTDNRPIHTAQFPSNWSLSVARAVTVVQLLKVLGVSPRRMVAAGYGKYHPIASNKTVAGRSKNRRVDIVILANSWRYRHEWPLVKSGSGRLGNIAHALP